MRPTLAARQVAATPPGQCGGAGPSCAAPPPPPRRSAPGHTTRAPCQAWWGLLCGVWWGRRSGSTHGIPAQSAPSSGGGGGARPCRGRGGGGRGPAAAVHCRAAARPRARTQIAFPPPAHSLRIATDARQAPLRPRRAPTCTPWTRHQTRPATAPGCEGRGWWARARGRWAGWRWFGNPVLTHALHPTPATPLGRAAGGPGAGRRGVGGRVV